MRKTTICVPDQVRHKPDCKVSEAGKKLEIYFFKKMIHCTVPVVKTMTLISYAVTAKPIRLSYMFSRMHIVFICASHFSNRT